MHKIVTENHYDAVIIGSGPGGGATAWALATQGVKVLVLEAGPSYNPLSDYHLHEPTWEQARFPDAAKYKGKYSFATKQPLTSRWDDLRSWNHITGRRNKTDVRRNGGYLHVRGVGGSTLHFTGEAHRLHPSAMQMRSRFGVAADWPFDYSALEPYYNIAENILGVAGPVSSKGRPRSKPYPLPPHRYGYASRRIITACDRLGIEWEPNSLAVLSRPYDDRPACNYCANCNRGCPRTDKGSVDVTFIRKALASGNCALKPNSPVIEVHAGANDRVESVTYLDGKGNEHSVKTRVLVIACGAIETPRLLLLSKNEYAPVGLANESGHVGKHFMETLYWASSGIHPEPMASYRGLPAEIISWDFNEPGSIPGVIGGCRFYHATGESGFLGPINYAKRVVKGWGAAHKQAMRETFGNALTIAAIGECPPNEKSLIDLDDEINDQLGLPVARIHSYLDEERLRGVSFMAERSREILQATGVEKIFEEKSTYDYFMSTHVFGTCRMGNNADDSVVDPYGCAHRWRNLYIADASVFPSSGGGEAPSLTIEALAIRSARRIRSRLATRDL